MLRLGSALCLALRAILCFFIPPLGATLGPTSYGSDRCNPISSTPRRESKESKGNKKIRRKRTKEE